MSVVQIDVIIGRELRLSMCMFLRCMDPLMIPTNGSEVEGIKYLRLSGIQWILFKVSRIVY